MHGCFEIIVRFLEPLIGDVSPVDRLEGVRNTLSVSSDWAWVWWAVILLGPAIVVAVLIIMESKSSRSWRERNRFQRYAARAGLDSEESRLLLHIANLAELDSPSSVYLADRTLEFGINRLMQSARVASMPERTYRHLGVMVRSIREKLGYSRNRRKEEDRITSSRQIPLGSRLCIMPREGDSPVVATIIRSEETRFVVKSSEALKPDPGDWSVLRFFNGLVQWEFETTVVDSKGLEVSFAHSQYLNIINRRRFPRVATHRPARVAPLASGDDVAGVENLAFEPATLVEIAGPGMVLQVGGHFQVSDGQAVVVTIEFEQAQLVNVRGKVRRALAGDEDSLLLVAELVELSPDQRAALVRETNQAAQETQQPNEVEKVGI